MVGHPNCTPSTINTCSLSSYNTFFIVLYCIYPFL